MSNDIPILLRQDAEAYDNAIYVSVDKECNYIQIQLNTIESLLFKYYERTEQFDKKNKIVYLQTLNEWKNYLKAPLAVRNSGFLEQYDNALQNRIVDSFSNNFKKILDEMISNL